MARLALMEETASAVHGLEMLRVHDFVLECLVAQIAGFGQLVVVLENDVMFLLAVLDDLAMLNHLGANVAAFH